MKYFNKHIINLILIICMVVLLCGCEDDTQSNHKNENEMVVYYVNKDATEIVNETYENKTADPLELAKDLLKQLHRNGKVETKRSAIPQSVNVQSVKIKDGIAVVDFDESYVEMNPQREVLCRAAVVLTLTQIKGIDYVAFTLNGTQYSRSDGVVIGNMKASDFVSDLGNGKNPFTTADFTLYFSNEEGTKLKPLKLSDKNYGDMSKEQFIVERLIKGPKKKGYKATLSPNLKLVSCMTSNNICYVDFDENFATEQSEVSNTMVIFSIVDSLSELPDVHKVQISINGNSALKYHDDLSLSEPFLRNLDIIEEQ